MARVNEAGGARVPRDPVATFDALGLLVETVAGAQTLERVYERALDALTSTLGVERAAILLFDPDGVMRFKAWRGLSDGYRDAVEGHNPWAPDDTDPRSVVVQDALADPDLLTLHPIIEREGIASLAFVPLRHGSSLLGKFMVYSAVPNGLSDEDVRLAEAIARHVAVAIEHKLHERRLSTHYSVARAVASASTVEDGLGAVLAELAELLSWRFASVWVVDERTHEIRCVRTWAQRDAGVEEFDDVTRSSVFVPGVGLPGRVWASGEPAWIRDASEDDNLPRATWAAKAGLHAACGFPIRVDGRVVAVVEFYSTDVRAPDQDLMELMVAVGGQVGQFIERKQAEIDLRERLRFLVRASDGLSSTLDPEETLQRIARLAVPFLADWCVTYVQTPAGSIRRLGVVHADPTKETIARRIVDGFAIDPETDAGVAHVVRSGAPSLRPDDAAATMAAVVEDREGLLALLDTLEVSSWMCVPLKSRGEVIGAVAFIASGSQRRFNQSDLDVANELAYRAGLALDNGRLYQERDQIARTLQESLLPPELPTIPAIDVAAAYLPGEGEVGGDFYDVFQTGSNTWAVVIGDVCGKGAEAAAVMAQARYTVRAAAMRERGPAGILRTVNEALVRAGGERFLTAAHLQLRLTGAEVRARVSVGGHPLPILVRADGSLREIGIGGTLLGVFHGPELYEDRERLEPGDSVVLFTDGVVDERASGGGPDRGLRDVLRANAGRTAGEIVEAIRALVLERTAGGAKDDAAFVVVRVRR
jgi:GAF domain-containing protein